MRRRALDTSRLTDAGRWENLVEQVLASPPPYRAAPGQPVYVIHAGDRAVLVGEQDLTGPLADLMETILETGEPPLASIPGKLADPLSQASLAGLTRIDAPTSTSLPELMSTGS